MLNYFLPTGVTFDLLLRVLIMVTLFASAYMAEVIRGGLQAIPRGQFEAADSMGLHYWSSIRLVILPQTLKISASVFISANLGNRIRYPLFWRRNLSAIQHWVFSA